MNFYFSTFWLHFKGVLFFSVGLNHPGSELKLSCDPAVGFYQGVSSGGAAGGRGGEEEQSMKFRPSAGRCSVAFWCLIVNEVQSRWSEEH